MTPSVPPTNTYPYFLPPPPGIDPNVAAALFQHQNQQRNPHSQISFYNPAAHPTPGSDTSVQSPRVDSPATATGAAGPSSSALNPHQSVKRPAKDTDGAGPRKKAKADEDEEDEEEKEVKDELSKPKATRGSRACTVCRRLKMKCVGAENGPPCKRCAGGNHECVFEESNRGKRPSKKADVLASSLRKMEQTLDTVLRSLANPHLKALTSGMVDDSPPSPISESPRPSSSLQDQTQHLTSAATHPAISPSPSVQTPRDAAATLGSVRSDSSLSHRQFPGSGSLGTAQPSQVQRPPSPKLHSLPDNSLNPLGLLVEASLSKRTDKTKEDIEEEEAALARMRSARPRGSAGPEETTTPTKIGVASDSFFRPGPMTILPLRRLFIERQIQPEMLTFVSTAEVVELFKIYFDILNLHAPMLDRNWHTPSLVCSRSPFLLTAICAVASKFFTERPELHSRLNKIVKKLAFSVPEQGFKSVEIVQAYLILGLWGCGPVERFEQDRTWMLLGLAIRMATDLNLHRKSHYTLGTTPEARQRALEIRNRERTWLMCFVLDRSFSAQMGKPHSIKEDYIIRNASQWWQTPDALPQDAGLAAYADYQRILSRSLDFLYSGTSTASGLQTDCDYLLIIKTVEAQLDQWDNEWKFHAENLRSQERGDFDYLLEYRDLISTFYINYAYLVVNSFGLQNALERSKVDIGHFFGRCHSSAIACANVVREGLAPKGYLRSSPDSHFVLFSYAVLSLLKLIRPEFKPFMENESKIISLVTEMADLLESVAVNPYHTPASYSNFLRALISAKTEASVPPSPSTKNQDPSALAPETAHGNHNASANGQHSDAPEARESTPPTDLGYPVPSYAGLFDVSGDMGGAQNPSVFHPTFPAPSQDNLGMFSMDTIFNNGFWDSVLIPGYSNSLEGLSGGFVYGAGGSGFITPRVNSPVVSGANTPLHPTYTSLPHRNMNPAFGSVAN